MTPSPYQSKLLRLAIAQYRSGLNRHRQALRQVRSTTVATVEIGAALALAPLFAMVQISRAARRQLKQSVEKNWGLGRDHNKLLSFSDFDRTSLATAKSSRLIKSSAAERLMVQTLRAVGNCLSFDQMDLLSEMDRTMQPSKTGFLAKLTAKKHISRSSQITGIASDLETRSLRLVIDCSWVWNGLSADQQMQLQSQIDRFLPSIEEGQSLQPLSSSTSALSDGLALSRKMAAAISTKQNALAQPLRSFWVEVLRAVARMKQQYRIRAITLLASGHSQIEGKEVSSVLQSLPEGFLPEHNGHETAKLPVITAVSHGIVSLVAGSRTEFDSNALISQASDDSEKQNSQPYCLEADVITVGYIEHPLEKLLKWVDRLFLWLEAQWQFLKHRWGL